MARMTARPAIPQALFECAWCVKQHDTYPHPADYLLWHDGGERRLFPDRSDIGAKPAPAGWYCRDCEKRIHPRPESDEYTLAQEIRLQHPGAPLFVFQAPGPRTWINPGEKDA